MIRKTKCSQEPVIANLVFNFTSKFRRKISADFFFRHLKFLLILNSDGSHLGSKIISDQVSTQKIVRRFFFSKDAKSL